jgi:hypothetical protein
MHALPRLSGMHSLAEHPPVPSLSPWPGTGPRQFYCAAGLGFSGLADPSSVYALGESDCVAGCASTTSGCTAFVLQPVNGNATAFRCARYSQPLPSSLPLPGLAPPLQPSSVSKGWGKG